MPLPAHALRSAPDGVASGTTRSSHVSSMIACSTTLGCWACERSIGWFNATRRRVSSSG